MMIGDRPPEPQSEDLEDLFENAPCGYLSLQADGRIFKVNTTLSTWLGVPPGQVLGKRLRDLLNVAGRIFYETHFAPLLRMQGHFDEVALDLITAEGTKLPVLASARERRSASGELLFTRVTLMRAVERRRYERDLVDARLAASAAGAATQSSLDLERKDAELREQFIAVLGHDLRNPLAAISGAARMLGRDLQTERSARLLKLMDGSVTRMSDLIDNVLDFARGRLGGGISLTRNASEPLETTLQQVIAELHSSHPDRDIQAHFAIVDPVNCDRGRIGQLASNLLGNALTHGAPEQPIRVSATTRDDMLEFWVANAGEPIESEALARLFQPFFRGGVRASQQGLGLGLHIASEIARAHEGRINVTSTDTETRFTFVMPLIPTS